MPFWVFLELEFKLLSIKKVEPEGLFPVSYKYENPEVKHFKLKNVLNFKIENCKVINMMKSSNIFLNS